MRRRNDVPLPEVVATIVHELKNPLTVLSQGASLLEDFRQGKIVGDAEPVLATFRTAIERLNTLVQNLLHLNSLDAPQSEVNRSHVSFRDILDKAIDPFRALAAIKKVTIEDDVPANLPKIYSDPARLEIVVSNLLSNAIKFSHAGGRVTVVARVKPIEGFPFVEVAVSDQGIGIPAGELESIFDRFMRGSNAGMVRGSGLGLAICRETVERLHGAMTVESEVGRGSIFRFTQPLRALRPSEIIWLGLKDKRRFHAEIRLANSTEIVNRYGDGARRAAIDWMERQIRGAIRSATDQVKRLADEGVSVTYESAPQDAEVVTERLVGRLLNERPMLGGQPIPLEFLHTLTEQV